MNASRRTALEPLALAVLLVAMAALLGAMPDWRAELGRFQALFLLSFAAYALALARRSRWRSLPGAGAFVVAVAFALRAAVWPAPPTLSDDIHRYVWEGRVLASGHDPYREAPASPTLAGLRDADIHPHVNHPELRAIYPPLALVGFALVARVQASRSALKAWVIAHDLALCALLAWWCRRRGGSGWDAAVYAWNPLVVTEYAGSGHHDPTGIVWLVAALALAERRPVASALAAASAVLVKLVALVAVPFLWRGWPRAARLAAAAVTGAGLLIYAWRALGPGSGLAAFGRHWRHNESLFAPLAAWLGDPVARVVVAVLAAAVLAAAMRARLDAVGGTRLMLRTGLLLGPVVHPWYLGWILALEPLGPSPAWLLLSATVTLAYGTFGAPAAGSAYHPDAVTRSIEYGAPALLAIAIAWRSRGGGERRVRAAAGGRTPRNER